MGVFFNHDNSLNKMFNSWGCCFPDGLEEAGTVVGVGFWGSTTDLQKYSLFHKGYEEIKEKKGSTKHLLKR